MMRARFDSVETVVGLTDNDHLNSRFVTLARTFFKVPKAYVAVESLDGQAAPAHVRQADAEVLFEGPHDIERWNVRFRQGAVEMQEVIFTEPLNQGVPADGEPVDPKQGAGPFGELCILLTIRNGKRAFPMRMGYIPKKGDQASVAVHTHENEKAWDQLRQQGWIPKSPEEPTSAPAS